jgi:hypothetical protein
MILLLSWFHLRTRKLYCWSIPQVINPEGSNLVFHFGCLEGYTKLMSDLKLHIPLKWSEQELITVVHGLAKGAYFAKPKYNYNTNDGKPPPYLYLYP